MNSLISLSDGELSKRPFCQFSSGYAARKFFSAPVMSLPPDVAKNIVTAKLIEMWSRVKGDNASYLTYIIILVAVLVAAVVLIVLLHALSWEALIRKGEFPAMVTIPPMLINPVFLALILTAIAIGDFYWAKWLRRRFRQEERTITFFSDRRSVTLRVADIDYVESNDTEVRLVTADGNAYRNKTGISQWENLLGEDFLRIHRSYLVNIARSRLVSPEEVIIGQHSLPVSRKYRESVSGTLRPDADAE